MRRLAARSLLELPNEKGSGSPNRVFPALICIDFRQSKMSGKQSGPDFEEEADEYLRVWVFLQAGLASFYNTVADQS